MKGRITLAAMLGSMACMIAACASGPPLPFDTGATATPVEDTAPPSTTPAVDLRPSAEAKYLGFMSPMVANVIREQAWFPGLSPLTLELVAAVQRCEKAAQPRGEVRSVADVLEFASEQAWYADGLDEHEVKGLSAVFDAYALSLQDDDAPAIGALLSSTVQWALFRSVQLPESGEVVLLASAPNEGLGSRLLTIASEYVGPVEDFAGRFPYRFLHFTATDELPEFLLGVSINEFILVNAATVEPYVVVHEIAHSTLYGLFPLWFEEGLAYFAEYYLTTSLEAGVREQTEWVLPGRDLRIDLSSNAAYVRDGRSAHESQGFLFLKGMFDIQGPEAFSATVRQLRTRTYSDNDLIRALTQQGPVEKQAAMREIVCQNFIGVRGVSCPGE